MQPSVAIFLVVCVMGTSWAANSEADERDLPSSSFTSSYNTPLFSQPAFPLFSLFSRPRPPAGKQRIAGTQFFGSAPPTPRSYRQVALPTYRTLAPTPRPQPLPQPLPQPVPQPVPQLRDATTLCAATVCPTPTVCRVVQTCPTCPPQASCVAPATVPPACDNGCLLNGYRQAVLLQALALPAQPLRSLRCIPWLPSLLRGGCSAGSACVPFTQPGAPAGTGTCCAGPAPAAVPLPLAPVPPAAPFVPNPRPPVGSAIPPPPLTAQTPVPVPPAPAPAPLVSSPAASRPAQVLPATGSNVSPPASGTSSLGSIWGPPPPQANPFII